MSDCYYEKYLGKTSYINQISMQSPQKLILTKETYENKFWGKVTLNQIKWK